MFEIIIMLKYDIKEVEKVSFNWLHDLILNNVKIQSFYHLPLYLAHIIHAVGCHTTHKKIAPPPGLIVWLTQWACSWDSPFLTQHQAWPSDWNPLILVSSLKITYYQSWVVQSWWQWANSNLQRTFLASSINFLCFSNGPKTCFMKCITQCVGAYYHIHWKHSSRLHHQIIHNCDVLTHACRWIRVMLIGLSLFQIDLSHEVCHNDSPIWKNGSHSWKLRMIVEW
jgi:hypothetical protein